jgi:hypothetical protein
MDEMSLIADGAGDGLGFEMLASALRADETDLHAFVEALASKLEGALPAQARIVRARDGLFKSTTHVERISVELGGFSYVLSVGKRGGLEATRAKIVGGIAIKNERLGLDSWIDGLARDLAVYAQSSAGARAALERLVT